MRGCFVRAVAASTRRPALPAVGPSRRCMPVAAQVLGLWRPLPSLAAGPWHLSGRRECSAIPSPHQTTGDSKGVAGGPRLGDMWDRPLAEASQLSGTAPAFGALASSNTFRRHLENAHHWRMVQILGDPAVSTPPSAAHVFYSCSVIEGVFLVVNLGTFSPLIFEMFMPYHLKYTALVLAWWGGTYVGLNIARYGPLSNGLWYTGRLLAGACFMLTGVVALILADGVANWGPWPSYWVLLSAYAGMAGLDVVLRKHLMIPPWLLKWKFAVSCLIATSLLLGVMKGVYLERNAHRLVLEEGERVLREIRRED